MILLFLLVNATYQTVIYQFQANFNIIDGWEDLEGYSNFFTCGVHKYFGSPNNFFFISRIFVDLEPHSHIKMEAEFLRIDDYAPLYFAINFIRMDYALVVSDQNNICGNSNSEQIHTISLIYSHNRRSIWIDSKFYNGGLKSFTLSIIKCQYESAGCIENYPNYQLYWTLHQYSFNHKLITNFDGWTFATNYITNLFCGRCEFVEFTQITYSTQIPPHEYILIRFFKDDWNTIIVDYVYGKQTISTNYLVEILIKNHYGSELLLDIKTQSNSIYSKIRDFELFYSKSEVQIQSFKEGCLEQVYDTCLICREGWIQDEFLENCIPICGDGIIQGQEECDDANLISNYSCYQCKYKCIEFCQICQFGICLQCVDGFEFSLNRQKCIPICNDGIIQQFEICDDQNNIQFDGCYKCQQNCDLRCQLCIDQKCQFCEIGWELRDNKCYSICGDGLIVQYSSEQCDDGNQIKNDGCFDCQLECKSNCLICLNYQVCIICQDHYQLEGQSCIPICGDGIIIAGFEDCDDGNIEPNDGCYQCCLDCEKGGFCKKCDNQYILNNQTAQCQQIEYLNNQNQDIDKNKDEIKNPLNILCQRNFILIDDQCVNQCGNGLLQEQEKCDDGNDQPADGCQDCLIQQNWKCITIIRDSPSQCTYVKAPNLVINYLNMTQNKQYISIQFNEQVKILTNQLLSETINFELLNIDKKKWNSSLNIIQDVGLYMSFGEYVVQIEVYQLLEFRPILKILLNQTVVNINNAALEDFERSITLQYPTYLDEKQKDYSNKLKSLNQYIIYGLSGITGWRVIC
ncbi:unnamed protein product [Paramecium pentaurelia]|uniref:Insulin-like growth factor binding protein, N-terminal n=1 Tax=Paramecium pentaurelia TaxID=43138 RepID=A0A8S1WAP8_9CILI|nr:unnamed protein product [Paramecium pentaurelia]